VDIDVSTALSGGVPTFQHRQMVLSCALVSGESLWDARRRLSESWQGHELEVSFTETPGRHLVGRCTLSDWKWPGKGDTVLFKFTLDAEPYLYDDQLTVVKVTATPEPGTPFTLTPTGYTVMPYVTVAGTSPVTLYTVGDEEGGEFPTVLRYESGYLALLLLRPRRPVSGRLVGPSGTVVTFEWRGGTPG